jgi:hypothetical protein
LVEVSVQERLIWLAETIFAIRLVGPDGGWGFPAHAKPAIRQLKAHSSLTERKLRFDVREQ